MRMLQFKQRHLNSVQNMEIVIYTVYMFVCAWDVTINRELAENRVKNVTIKIG